MTLKDELIELNKKFQSEQMAFAKEKFKEISLLCRTAAGEGKTSITVPRDYVCNIT